MQRLTPRGEALQWDDVRLFLALSRAKTVGRAAASLGVDPSTVSRRLLALEEVLATTLFDRGRDGIAATEAAEELLPVAEEIERSMMRFASAADGLEREVSGVVRMTCPAELAEMVIVPFLHQLFERHPALRLEVEPGEAVLDLTRREADIALRIVRPTHGDLVVTRVRTLRWILAASPALAKKLGTLRAWSDAPWIGCGESLEHMAVSRWFSQVRGREPLLRSDSLRVQLSALANGLGVGLVPDPSLEHYGLVPVKLAPRLREASTTWPTNELFLVTHRALRTVPRVRVLWEWLLERLAAR